MDPFSTHCEINATVCRTIPVRKGGRDGGPREPVLCAEISSGNVYQVVCVLCSNPERKQGRESATGKKMGKKIGWPYNYSCRWLVGIVSKVPLLGAAGVALKLLNAIINFNFQFCRSAHATSRPNSAGFACFPFCFSFLLRDGLESIYRRRTTNL